MKYELLEDIEEPSTLGTDIAKGAIRTGARLFESAAGTPGNILSTGLGALNYVGQAIGDPHPIPTYEQIQEKLPVSFPTTAQLRGATQNLTGSELEPESPLGEKYDSAVQTVGNLIAGGTNFIPAIKGAIGGELFDTVAEYLGGGDLVRGIAKTAGIFSGVGTFRGRELKKTYEENYDKFGKSIEGKKVPSKELYQDIEKIYDEYVASGDSPAKNFARERLKAIEQSIDGDSIDASKLWKLKKNANKFFAEASSDERKVLTQIIEAEKKALAHLGPDYKFLEAADDIYSSFMQSSSAMRVIKKAIPNADSLVPWLKPILGIGAHATQKLPYAAGAYGIFKGAKEINMARKFLGTNTGKEFYTKILKDAAGGSAATIAKDVAKLNNAAKKFEHDESKPKYELLED